MNWHKARASDPVTAFWSQVEKTVGGCWLWTGSKWNTGYGRFKRDGQVIGAHRMAFRLAKGPIAPTLVVMHSCDVKLCCNPAHLSLGTHTENIADRDAKGRQASGKRHGSRTKPERMPRGEMAGASKLTAEFVVELRQRVAAGETVTQIARDFGLSKSTTARAANGATWSHV